MPCNPSERPHGLPMPCGPRLLIWIPQTLLVFSPRLPIWNLQSQPGGRGLHALSHQQPDHLGGGDQLCVPERLLPSRPGPPRHAVYKYARGPGSVRGPPASRAPLRKARSRGWAGGGLAPASLSCSGSGQAPGGRGNEKLVGKGPSWGPRAANAQRPWSWHLAPSLLLPVAWSMKSRSRFTKGRSGRLGRRRTNTGGVCDRKGCPVF